MIRRKIAVVASAICLAAALVTPASANTIVHTTDPALAASCEKVVGTTFENGSWILVYEDDGTCHLAVDPPEPIFPDDAPSPL